MTAEILSRPDAVAFHELISGDVVTVDRKGVDREPIDAPTPRAQSVLAGYSLEVLTTATATKYLATCWHAGSPLGAVLGDDLGEVRRLARAYWGHMNFSDESRAFASIFCD